MSDEFVVTASILVKFSPMIWTFTFIPGAAISGTKNMSANPAAGGCSGARSIDTAKIILSSAVLVEPDSSEASKSIVCAAAVNLSTV